MNRYPAWKYILLVVVLAIGVIYALPNLFGEDPAVQVSSARGFDLQPELSETVTDTLDDEGIDYSATDFTPQRMLVRFGNTDRQLRAQDVLRETLGDQYVVALNLAPATPTWLRMLNASPMVLGLDLQGGVHFLMQVDMQTARRQELEGNVDDIRVALRNESIRYRSVRQVRDHIIVELRSAEDRENARGIIREQNPDLVLEEVSEGETFNLRARIDETALEELQQEALQQNITTLRTRVNELGVAEPVIQQQGSNRIVVQLPGVQDTAQAKNILGATATLEYRKVLERGADAFEAQRTGRVPPGGQLFETREGQPVVLSREVIAKGDQLTGAAAGFDQQTGAPNVVVTLNAAGANSMLEFTRENVGNFMAVVFIEHRPVTRMEDGEEILTTERVEEVMWREKKLFPNADFFHASAYHFMDNDVLSNRFQTTGLGSAEEATQLAMLLRAGALAAPIRIIEERTVGPSLGQDNIDQGFRSVIIGFCLVLVLMAVYYKAFGLVADMALTANLVLIVALLSMLGATLTLPGIAGIVLTVGMAVDANVLIFERIREELRNGNTPQASIRAGYEKAFSTIADANVTTLIAAIVLFMFGTGPIKGFAVTLSLGIVTSMFTAILGTRAVINLVYGRRQRLKKLAI